MKIRRRENMEFKDSAIGRFIHSVDQARELLIAEVMDWSAWREDAAFILRAYVDGKITEADALDKLGFGKRPRGGPTA